MDATTGLLEAILNDPTDDPLRLVYADALEERGQPGDLDHANFIRAQLALAGLREPGIKTPGNIHDLSDEEYNWANCCGGCKWDGFTRNGTLCAYHDAKRVERATLAAGWPKLWSNLWPRASHDVGPYVDVLITGRPGRTDIPRPLAVFWRGMVDQIAITEKDWVTYGPRMVGLHPIRRVRLIDKEPHLTTTARPIGGADPIYNVGQWRRGFDLDDANDPNDGANYLFPEIHDRLTAKQFWVGVDMLMRDCSDACLAWAKGAAWAQRWTP